MDYVDKALIRWMFGSFLLVMSLANIASLGSVLQNGLTPSSWIHTTLGAIVTLLITMISFELLINISQSLFASKKPLMKFFSFMIRQRTVTLNDLIRYWIFFEIIHNKRTFTFHFGFTKMTRKSCLFYLLFTFSTGVLFVAKKFEI